MDAKKQERQVEQWVDVALNRYAKAEPRPGLEGRVLANLQAERNRLTAQRRWWWAVGTVGVAAAIIITVWVGAGNQRNVPLRNVETGTKHHDDASSRPPAPRPPVARHAEAFANNRRQPPTSALTQHVKEPKLDRFPSLVPLTDQEKMLARYVQEFPGRAVLVARTQTELRKQTEREMSAPWVVDSRTLDQPE